MKLLKIILPAVLFTLAVSLFPLPLAAQSTAPGVTLAVGQKTTASILPLEADGKTPSGASVGNVQWTCGAPSFNATGNAANNTLVIAGTLVSNGPVSCTVSAQTTDSDGLVQQLSLTFTITVTASATPPPTRTATLGISFTPPQ